MGRVIRLLNLRRLTSIRLRMVIAVVAVAAGSSLALSVVIVSESISHSIKQLSQEVATGANLRVVGATSTGGVNFAALHAAASTPGVAEAIPVVQAITVVRTKPRHHQTVVVLGVTCGASALFPAPACATSTSSPPSGIFIAPALQRRLVGSSWLQTDDGLQSLRTATANPALDHVNHGDVVVMSLAQSQREFDRIGRVDDVYLVPVADVSARALRARVARAVGAWDGVVNATSAPPAVSLALGAFTPILALLALLAAAIAVVLMYNVISLTLVERRREHAIIASIGAPPSVLVLGPLLEAGVLGAVGGLVGAAGGVILARPIISTVSTFALGLSGVPITEHTTPSTFVVGVAVGLVIGVLAAAVPVRRAMRVDIAAELSGREQRERSSSRATWRAAMTYTAVAVAGAVVAWFGERNGSLNSWQPAAAFLGFGVTTLSSILALGAWTPVFIRFLSSGRRRRGGVVRLGLANLVREPGRTGVMAIAIGATVGVAFITGSYNHAIDQDIASGLAKSPQAHGVVVTTVAGGNGFNTDARIPTGVLSRLARLPGVTDVDHYDDVLAGYTPGHLTLIESDSRPTFHLHVYAGTADAAALAHGQVVVGANLARRDHLRPGALLPVDTPSGFVSVRVRGIWDNGDATGDNLSMSVAEATRLFGAQHPAAVALVVAPGTSPASVVAAARAAHLGSYLKYATPAKELRTSQSSISSQLAPFLVLQRALLLVSFISVLSTLLLVGVQRRREFGLLAAVGMTPKELFRMVVAEALVVGVVAAALGSVVGFLSLATLLDVTPLVAGYHDTYAPDLLSLAVYAPIAVVVAVAAALWPGWRASRTPILEALTYE